MSPRYFLLKFFTLSGLILFIGGHTSYADHEQTTPDCADLENVCQYLHASVKTKTTISSRFESPFDVSDSNVGVTVGKENLNSILNHFGAPDFQNADNIINLSFRASVLPYLIHDSTVDQLYANLDDILAHKRVNLLAGAERTIDAQLAPDKPLMPQALYDKTRSGFLAGATAQIDQQLAVARTIQREVFKKRAKDLETETAFQEFAISYANVVGRGQVLLFVKVGKFHMASSAAENENQETYLENLTGHNSLVQRSNGPADTGAVQFSVASQVTDKIALRVDAYFFHDRLSFISGKNYVAGVAALPDELYGKQDNWWKIDSEMIRVLLTSEKIDAYVTFANYDEHKSGGAGITYRITEQDIVMVDFSAGRPDQFIGASVFYVRKLNTSWNVYGGWERVVDSYQPYNAGSDQAQLSTSEWVVGTKKFFTLYKTGSLQATLDLSGQISYLIDDEKDGERTAAETGLDVSAGAVLNGRWK